MWSISSPHNATRINASRLFQFNLTPKGPTTFLPFSTSYYGEIHKGKMRENGAN